ncbi:MAG: biopolymer transporter ExbD [Verrucomicrobiales bacterium]
MASDKLRSYNSAEDSDGEMDMSPMIDMVFLLLLFFLVVSNPKLVKIDPEVKIPVADNAKIAEIKHGRIVVNVRENGDYFDESVQQQLSTDEDLQDYIDELKGQIENQGYTPRLHLRGDSESVFRYSRRVIRAAAAVGVNEVIFASYIK